jgi:hypothetical protein
MEELEKKMREIIEKTPSVSYQDTSDYILGILFAKGIITDKEFTKFAKLVKELRG